MDRRKFIQHSSSTIAGSLLVSPALASSIPSRKPMAVGVIGLDTSHAPAFTGLINSDEADEVKEFTVTHAYPYGSREIESSYSRIPRYTAELKEMGIKIVDSIEALIQSVDRILLLTNDGRLHLDQAKQVINAEKPLFIDKPMAGSLAEAMEIFDYAEKLNVPVFSASSLRFSPTTIAVASGNKIGQVLSATTYSPAKLEPTHPDLFWYGIHGVEALLSLMGAGCKQVRRVFKEDAEMVIGEWEDGRIGSFLGIRKGKSGYGGTAFGTEGITAAGGYEGYAPLVLEICKFFQTGTPPVSADQTLEVFAFMEAAHESRRRGGEAVELAWVMEQAKLKR